MFMQNFVVLSAAVCDIMLTEKNLVTMLTTILLLLPPAVMIIQHLLLYVLSRPSSLCG